MSAITRQGVTKLYHIQAEVEDFYRKIWQFSSEGWIKLITQ